MSTAAMDEFRDAAADEDVLLVEDAAHAHGARFDGEHVGTFGDAAAFSFYPTKNMTTGEGGMVVTNDEAVAAGAARYVNHGRGAAGGYEHREVGSNHRMTSIAAAIGRVQLERLPEWVEQRRQNARLLTDAVHDVDGVRPPVEPDRRRHAFHQYTLRCPDRDTLAAHLREYGVDSSVFYPSAIPDLEAYASVSANVPRARAASEEVLSIPVHPGLTSVDRDRIVTAIRSADIEAN